MYMKINWSYLKNQVLRFITVQLVLILCSFPILVWWGLPISLLSIIGNLIFTPFLMIFLFISSLILFTEMCAIPNMLLIKLLEKISLCWKWGLNVIEYYPVLFSCYKPSLLLLISIPCMVLIIIHNQCTARLERSALLLTILLACIIIFLKISIHYQTNFAPIMHKQDTIPLYKVNNQLIMIDPGILGKHANVHNWVRYTFSSELHKLYGTDQIEYLIVLKLNQRTLEALLILTSVIQIKNIYLPAWKHKMHQPYAKIYWQLLRELKKQNCIIYHCGNYKKTIRLSATSTIIIEPTLKEITYHQTTYPELFVHGSIDKQPLSIYAANKRVT